MTTVRAPMPTATLAAFVPTVPPPMMTTFAGGTPVTPPSSTPRPPFSFCRCVAPAWMAKRAGDLAHREEQRVGAVRELDRLVGDRPDVGGEHALGEVLGVGRGQMQVRVEDLALLEHGPLDRQRLLDLDDHVGPGEDLFDLGQRGAGGLVGGVLEAAADACALLDEDGVAGAHELLDAVRRDRDAVLLVLDLLGDNRRS